MFQLNVILIFCILNFEMIEAQLGLLNGRQDTFVNLASVTGYPNEVHRVETDDGYLLKIHRILPKLPREKKGPVLLIHGLFGSASDFILAGPQVSLAYYLSDEGYDVWLGNVRGSRHSMRHQSIDPKSREFWKFSFHEIGFYDLPAIINYILGMTQKPSLFYVGHNQGTTALLVLLSTRPEFNAKIIQAHLLAPIAFMDYPHPLIGYRSEEYEQQMRILGIFNFPSMVDYLKLIIDTYCNQGSSGSLSYCSDLWSLIFGRNKGIQEIDPNLFLLLPNFISPTASVMQWIHYLQLSQSGKFQRFSFQQSMYGGREVTGEYVKENIRAPLYLYHADDDLIVSRLDVERLKNSVLGSIRDYKVITNFNHMDLIYSRNARTVLYNGIVKAMNSESFEILEFVKGILRLK